MIGLLVAADEPLVRWGWIADHLDDVWERTQQHVTLTVVSVAAGLAISSLLVVLGLRWRWTVAPITWVAGVLYTIPSLALFGILVPITGLGTTTALIALTSYTVLILFRNILAGIDAVPSAVRDAADGMGYTPRRRLLRVEIPLALPTIIAGLRLASVTVVGLATIATLVGAGGYGVFIEDGLNRRFPTPIVLGAVLSVVLALLVDAGFVLIGRVFTPWRSRSAQSSRPRPPQASVPGL